MNRLERLKSYVEENGCTLEDVTSDTVTVGYEFMGFKARCISNCPQFAIEHAKCAAIRDAIESVGDDRLNCDNEGTISFPFVLLGTYSLLALPTSQEVVPKPLPDPRSIWQASGMMSAPESTATTMG